MSHHRYPLASLLADYARALIGLGVLVVPLYFSGLAGFAGYLLLAFALLFFAYGVRTALRHAMVVELSDIGLRTAGPLGKGIRWEDIADVQLRYYSTRRDRKDGWMNLKLKGAGQSIAIDSTLEGFDTVLDRVAEVAQARELELNSTTVENLENRKVGAERAV